MLLQRAVTWSPLAGESSGAEIRKTAGNHVGVEWDKGAQVEISTAPAPPVSLSLFAMHFLVREARRYRSWVSCNTRGTVPLILNPVYFLAYFEPCSM